MTLIDLLLLVVFSSVSIYLVIRLGTSKAKPERQLIVATTLAISVVSYEILPFVIHDMHWLAKLLISPLMGWVTTMRVVYLRKYYNPSYKKTSNK